MSASVGQSSPSAIREVTHSIRIALSRRIYLRSERSGILVPVEGGKELKFMHVPYKRNPIRCQFTTVRGVTKTRGFLHPNQNVLNATQNSLSRAVNRVRGGKENPTANPGSIVPKFFLAGPPALAFTPSGSLLGISKTKRQTADRKEIEGVARVLPSSALLQCVQAQFFSQTLLG